MVHKFHRQRPTNYVRRMPVKKTIGIGMLLFLLVPARAVSQEPDNSGKAANKFARSILVNEVKAEAEDHSHWMFQLETDKPQRNEVDQVAETRNGDLKRPALINGRPLTAQQEHDADERIQKLIRDSQALRGSKKKEDRDAAQSRRLLKMLPEAMRSNCTSHQIRTSGRPLTRLRSFKPWKGTSGSTANKPGSWRSQDISLTRSNSRAVCWAI